MIWEDLISPVLTESLSVEGPAQVPDPCEWVGAIRGQCLQRNVTFFFKQGGLPQEEGRANP